VRWADGLILRCSWKSSRCYVFHRRGFGPNIRWNIIDSIHSIRTYVNTPASVFPTCHRNHDSYILIGSLESLSILICEGRNLPSHCQWGSSWPVSLRTPQYPSLSLPSFLPKIVLHCIPVSTWWHLKGNCWMKCEQMEGHSSFARVRIIPHTLHPILPASSWICILQSYSMVLSGNNFFWWDQSAPPSASHLCTELGVECWMSGHSCRSALDKSLSWKLNLATLGGYHWLVCMRAVPNRSPVTYCIACPTSLPPELHLHISSKTSKPTVTECIPHYQHCLKAAQSRKSPKNLQLPSASAVVHPAAVSNGSFPGSWTDASSPETQPPILSSTCWMYQSWAAPSFWQIASRRIRFASCWLGICLRPRPGSTNHCYHNLPWICRCKSLFMRANPHWLQLFGWEANEGSRRCAEISSLWSWAGRCGPNDWNVSRQCWRH